MSKECELREKHKIIRCDIGNCETCERVFNWTERIKKETSLKFWEKCKVLALLEDTEERPKNEYRFRLVDIMRIFKKASEDLGVKFENGHAFIEEQENERN